MSTIVVVTYGESWHYLILSVRVRRHLPRPVLIDDVRTFTHAVVALCLSAIWAGVVVEIFADHLQLPPKQQRDIALPQHVCEGSCVIGQYKSRQVSPHSYR